MPVGVYLTYKLLTETQYSTSSQNIHVEDGDSLEFNSALSSPASLRHNKSLFISVGSVAEEGDAYPVFLLLYKGRFV